MLEKIIYTSVNTLTNLNKNEFKKYSRLLLQIYDQNDTSIYDEDEENYTCICCFAKFNNKYKLAAHYRTNKDCRILFLLENNTPKPCPNQKCNTWWLNNKELEKHIKYHCHLTNDEKLYFSTQQNEGKINRNNPREMGLPNKDIIIGNNSVQYDPINKEWHCLKCSYKRTKYEWQHVLNHANPKRK